MVAPSADSSDAGIDGDTIPAAMTPPDIEDSERSDVLLPETRPWRRRRRWFYAGGAVAALLVVAIAAASLIPVSYYTLSPGSVRATKNLLRVEGAPTYDDPGSISFTTVSLTSATALGVLWGWLDPATDVVEKKAVLGDESPEDNRKRNLEMMDGSKQVAEYVALRKLGYDVSMSGTGAVVHTVVPGSAAEAVLQPGDVVIEADGQPISIGDDLVAAISSHRPGERMRLLVEPGSDGPRTVDVELGSHPEDESLPFLGIAVGTRDRRFHLPFDVTIDSGDVGGPSAGLAFTLAIIDVLTPGSLTGGKKVATTGTIDARGNVGNVGGVHQKIVAGNRAGVELFLVPSDEYEEATKWAADGMEVVPVNTLDDALRVLAERGGGAEVIDQRASAAVEAGR
ncbi:MAG: PDZ domain-containing protein [Acidimicrobiales bacterium]|nr:PDZ domain-containing protein [Acidimicrobiales bacterium]